MQGLHHLEIMHGTTRFARKSHDGPESGCPANGRDIISKRKMRGKEQTHLLIFPSSFSCFSDLVASSLDSCPSFAPCLPACTHPPTWSLRSWRPRTQARAPARHDNDRRSPSSLFQYEATMASAGKRPTSATILHRRSITRVRIYWYCAEDDSPLRWPVASSTRYQERNKLCANATASTLQRPGPIVAGICFLHNPVNNPQPSIHPLVPLRVRARGARSHGTTVH